MLLRAAKLLLSVILTLKVAHCLPANRIALGQLGVLTLCVSFLIFFLSFLFYFLLGYSLSFSLVATLMLALSFPGTVFVFLFYSILSQFVFFYANPSPPTLSYHLSHTTLLLMSFLSPSVSLSFTHCLLSCSLTLF